jgi:hypothetical protein
MKSVVQTELNRRIDEISRHDVLLMKLIEAGFALNCFKGEETCLLTALRNNKKANEFLDSFNTTREILDELIYEGKEEVKEEEVTDDKGKLDKDDSAEELSKTNTGYAMLIYKLSSEIDKLRVQLQLANLDQVKTILNK